MPRTNMTTTKRLAILRGWRDTIQKFNNLQAAAPSYAEIKAQRDEPLEALLTAVDHLDMAALEISHRKDAARIRAELAKSYLSLSMPEAKVEGGAA